MKKLFFFQFPKPFVPSLFFLGIILLSSCSRLEEIKPDSSQPKGNFILSSRSPSYIGDRLYFTDFNDFADYFLELDSLFEVNQYAFDSIIKVQTPITTITELVSDSLGYNTWLSDPIMRAILNSHFEFQIDTALITYISDGQILVSDAASITAKSDIRALVKGTTLDLEDLPSEAYWGTPENLETAIKIGCGCKIDIHPLNCTTVRVYGSCHGFWGNDGDGDVTITFTRDGAPFPVTIDGDDVSGNFEFLIGVGQFLGHAGTITATVDPECALANPQTVNFHFDPDEFVGCDIQERNVGEYIYNAGNTERMLNITSFYRNFWGDYHKSEITSETKSGSNWIRSNANLFADIDANRKSLGCSLVDSKEDDKSCTSCKSLAIRVSWTGICFHCDGDVVGMYRKIKSGSTLSNTQSINFDCCE